MKKVLAALGVLILISLALPLTVLATPTAATVVLSGTSALGSATATITGSITDTGGDDPYVALYYGTTDHPGDPASWDYGSLSPDTPSQPQGVEGFSRALSSLSPGTLYYFSAQASNVAGDSWPIASGTFITLPDPPTNVDATDGTYIDKVTITWTKSTGASDYDVWRDSTDLGLVGDVDTFDDIGAAAGVVTPGTASATAGTAYGKVTIDLSGQSVADGVSSTYKVVASNTSGNSADSSPDDGYRGAGILTYQWYRSSGPTDGNYSTLGLSANTAPYDDTTAPAPTVTAGVASASKGTSLTQVSLNLSGQAANVGATRWYYCVVGATGGSVSQDSTHSSGYEEVGSLTYQWGRSAADSDANYFPLAGANTASYNDLTAPSVGGRYYECLVGATGATPGLSSADRGYETLPVPPPSSTSNTLQGIIAAVFMLVGIVGMFSSIATGKALTVPGFMVVAICGILTILGGVVLAGLI